MNFPSQLTALQAEVLDHSNQVHTEIGDLSLSGLLNALIGAEMVDPGCVAINVLRLAANVVHATTVTIGNDVYEVHTVATDTTIDVSLGELAVGTTTAPRSVTMAAHGLVRGAILRIESEFLQVIGIVDADTVIVSRGYAGSTIATHANATSIYKAASGPVAGRIPVPSDGTLTPTEWSPQLVAQINALGTEPVTATLISVNEVLLTSNEASAQATACTETLAGANNVFASATMYGGRAPGQRRLSVQTRVPNATEVALATMHFAFDFAPTIVAVLVNVTATPGISKAWSGAATVAGNVVSLDNAGGTAWAATDTVVLVVIG